MQQRYPDSTAPAPSLLVRHAQLTGYLTGGCLLPFLLFLIAGLLGDTGDPLIWPAPALLLGIIGTFTGAMVRRWITAPQSQ